MSQTVSAQDRIVVVMGPTGSGKSTFIECATCQNGQTVGHSLRSRTADIRAVRATHPKGGYPVVFVDTPGFDDTVKSDVEILSAIADWLVTVYKKNVNLAAIVYLHKISDNRMTGSLLKNLRMFSSVCGQRAMPSVVIATTMWSKVEVEEGERREEELRSDFWKDIVAGGGRTERFEKTYHSAWRIIGHSSGTDRSEGGRARGNLVTAPLLPREIVDDHLRLNETRAGVTLNKELEKLIQDRKDAVLRLEQQVKRQDDELIVQQLNEQAAEIDNKIRQTADQLLAMKIPFTRKVRMFFKAKRN